LSFEGTETKQPHRKLFYSISFKLILMVKVSELEHMARQCSKRTGIEYYVDQAYGKYRLMTADQSRDVSPRLSGSDLMDWMDAFCTGIDETTRMRERKNKK
jgi:hypothetical protein